MRKLTPLVFTAILMLSGMAQAVAQCAMCAATVESNTNDGGHTAQTLNLGIMYLFFMPWTIISIVAFLFYRSYKKRKQAEKQLQS
jgi:hypothetical protein